MMMNLLEVLLTIFAFGICLLGAITILILCFRWAYFLADLIFPDDEKGENNDDLASLL